MKDLTSNILIGAFIGSLFTIITNRVIEIIKRYRIKKTINSWLKETIEPITIALKKELIVVSTAIEIFNGKGVELGSYPTFNATVLKSFSTTDLHIIYGENFSKIINIIGYIDNLETRLPYTYHKKCIDETENHLDENFEKHNNLFKTRLEHFSNCPTLISKRNLIIANLNNVETIINNLKTHIDSIINNQKK